MVGASISVFLAICTLIGCGSVSRLWMRGSTENGKSGYEGEVGVEFDPAPPSEPQQDEKDNSE